MNQPIDMDECNGGTSSVNDTQTAHAIAAWCEHGDEAAASWLVAHYRPLVAGIAHRRLQAWWLAEDAVQDTLTQMLACLHHYRPLRPFAAWLARVASHRCGAQLAAFGRRRVLGHTELGFDSLPELAPSLADPNASAAPGAEEFGDSSQALLARLRETDREIFLLHCVEGCTADEVAQRTGLSAGAVRVRAHRARRTLRKAPLASMPRGCSMLSTRD